jgi:hypothetical protein
VGDFLIEKEEFPIRKIKLSIRKLGVSNKETENPSEENPRTRCTRDSEVFAEGAVRYVLRL